MFYTNQQGFYVCVKQFPATGQDTVRFIASSTQKLLPVLPKAIQYQIYWYIKKTMWANRIIFLIE